MAVMAYYHVWAGGTWPQPVAEHLAALQEAGYDGEITVGIVGESLDREAVRGVMEPALRKDGLTSHWLEWDEGYEQLTLAAMREWAADAPAGTPVMYAHAKGSYDGSAWNAVWRRSMTRHVVGGWRGCVELLADLGWDTAGCHWLTPERDNDPPDRPVTTPMYGGNFWWAKAGYLAKLPPPLTDHRHRAEEWIGLGSPKACDLLPGWPTLELCRPYATGGDEAGCACPRCQAVREAAAAQPGLPPQ